MDQLARQPGTMLDDLLRQYRSEVSGADELIAADGSVRPAWCDFGAHLAHLTPEALNHRFRRGDQYLRDAGILFRKYDDSSSTERDWPLSHIPVVLPDAEWQTIASGLIERADLLEAVVADIYGPNQLVRDKHLPASLVAQNPAWLRPLVGIKPASGHFLNFLSFEIGRGPDGRWWVLSDMTEAPAGAGFALENRVATSRVFPNFYANANIHRLAGFFQDFQQYLFSQRGPVDGQVAILSPGILNDGYFEHAYIARYLGLLLVEGEDLIIQNGAVMVRTVAGLKPVSLLWRRMNGRMCDPLELDETSHLGTPGLVDAVRRQQVSMFNALGSGIIETRALMAFLPRISRALMDRKLSLPNIATWWCGQAGESQHVLANRDRMMIGSAYSTRPLIEDVGGTFLAAATTDQDDDQMAHLLETQGRDLVGQEAVTLSTTPVWHEGALVPRPMCLRVFLARTASGWRAMPGGYARVSVGRDTTAFAMQKGGKVADVWIASDQPVPKPSLLTGSLAHLHDNRESKALPSRAADNLFWLGRYVERAELNMRLFRAYFARRADGIDDDAPIMVFMRHALMDKAGPNPNAMAALFEQPLSGALRCSERISDRFSTDGLMALKDLMRTTSILGAETFTTEEMTQQISVLLRQITGFSGLVHENMYRSIGWRFLSLGVSVERAANMATLLAQVTGPDVPFGALDMALEVGDSTMTYRLRYSVSASPETVLDLLALDEANPRALLYHLSRAKDHIAEFPGSIANRRLSPVARQALELHTSLAVEEPETLTPDRLFALREEIWKLSGLLTATHLR